MAEYKKCKFCEKPVFRGRYSKRRDHDRCYICNEIVCLECGKHGICPDHLNKMTPELINKVRKIRIGWNIFAIFGPVLLTLFITFLISRNQDSIIGSWLILHRILTASILTVMLIGGVISTIVLRDKRVKKIVRPLKLEEGILDL